MWTDAYGYAPLNTPSGRYITGGVENYNAHREMINGGDERSVHYQLVQYNWERGNRMLADQVEEDEIARRCLEAAHEDYSMPE